MINIYTILCCLAGAYILWYCYKRFYVYRDVEPQEEYDHPDHYLFSEAEE